MIRKVSVYIYAAILNQKRERFYSQSELEQMRREREEVVEDLAKVHEDAPRYKSVPTISKRQYEVMQRKEKKMEDRYKPVRAPYKNKKV